MSFDAFVWAWRQPLAKDEHLIVLLTLANIANENHEIFAGQPYIAAMARKEERTIRRALIAMRDMIPSPITIRARPGFTDVITLNIPEEFTMKRLRPPDGGKKRGRPKTLDSNAESPGHLGEKPPTNVSDEPIEVTNKGTSIDKRAADEFDVWWAIYPRKVAKVAARKVWKATQAKIGIEDLAELTRRFADHVVGTDPQYIAHPAKWLKDERWTDELPNRSQTDGQIAGPARGTDRAADRAAREINSMEQGFRLAATGGRRRWTLPGS